MLNRVCLVGRLTRDPELRIGASSMPMTTFTIAVDGFAKKNQQDGQQSNRGDETLFMSCVCFGNRAETIHKFMRKGSLVSVEGRLRQRKYTNKDGIQVTVIETVADGVEFLEPKSAGDRSISQEQSGSGYVSQTPAPQENNMDSIDVSADDDLPF